MARRGTRAAAGSVRLGPVSVFVLVMGVCLAVLAVLCITTAQAQLATAERQEATLQATYLNERLGQSLLAAVSDSLAQSRAEGRSLAEADAAAEQAARDAAAQASAAGVACEVARDGSTLTAVFTGAQGRMLTVALSWDSALTGSVDSWVVYSMIPEEPGPGLWTGPAS